MKLSTVNTGHLTATGVQFLQLLLMILRQGCLLVKIP